jgi:hypothetical protein
MIKPSIIHLNINLEKGDTIMEYKAPRATVVDFKAQYVIADPSVGVISGNNTQINYESTKKVAKARGFQDWVYYRFFR